MAKLKRRPSKSQRDKLAISTAKVLKQKGILSKQTKLHGGKYISPGVLRKVQEYQHAARPHYTAVKVSKPVAKAAKEQGYQVANGRVLVPRDHEFIKRVKRGELAGVKPVKGGFMSEVMLPFDARNYDELLQLLRTENLDDLKLPQERFAFKVGGTEGSPMGMSYRSFGNGAEIARYLEHYKPDVFITGLKFFRMHPEDERQFIIGRTAREKYRRAHRTPGDRREGSKGQYARRMERLERTNPKKAEKIRKENAARSRALYEKQKTNPEYMEKARKRALESYRRRKK
jgi:hypothetical protein